MPTDYSSNISTSLNLKNHQVKNTIKLLNEDATIPFIARYRKEMTGSLDEVQIGLIQDQLNKLAEIDKRRDSIIKLMTEHETLTNELERQLKEASSLTELEDIYLPYKPKRKTRATKAIEKGLEGLAKIIMKQQELNIDGRAQQFVKGDVNSIDEAYQGARDIIAEWISENQHARNKIRRLFQYEATIKSKLVKGKDEEAQKYKDYFDWEEPLRKCPSHRLLAMRRGEEESFLRVAIAPPDGKALDILNEQFVRGNYEVSEQVKLAAKDSYKRLLSSSIETEFRQSSKEKADEGAISVFSENLRQLLLAPPLGQKRILAIDPGFRTGCKVVCLGEHGNLLHNETIYPHAPQKESGPAMKKIMGLVNAHKIEAISIGNGTAGRETEYFIKKIRFDRDLQVFVVNENGASIYSASSIAREEFPDYDVTVRGAVSIGRRLMDPLAELVKIDPKSIGVGQYQHDVDQKKLKEGLDQVVESVVNNVGVELNTASKHLLAHVSGLSVKQAENIVKYRDENDGFKSRSELKDVPQMGAKAFEQAAGFLRIKGASNPLDSSAVHPERYKVIAAMAKKLGCKTEELVSNEELVSQIDITNYVTDELGEPTLNDILQELSKPGRDPRKKAKVFEFAKGIHNMEDLHIGMELPGIVSNITNFGAFVDIGIKQDGLVHVSQIADEFVSNPAEYVSLHQHVKVKVTEVDIPRKRIQLSMKGIEQ